MVQALLVVGQVALVGVVLTPAQEAHASQGFEGLSFAKVPETDCCIRPQQEVCTCVTEFYVR